MDFIRNRPGRPWRRCLAVLLIALLPVVYSSVQAAEAHPYGEGLLWRIERDGVAPSYLFGTMHSAEREVIALPDPVAEAFGTANSLVLEIVMSAEVQLVLSQSMILFDGRTLSEIAGPGLAQRIVATGARYGMAAEQLQLLRPWAVMLLFSVPPSEFLRQSTGRVPLDQVLQEQGRARGMALHSLETIEEQVAALAALPEADQLALLDDTLVLNPQIEQVFETMKQAYLARDLAALHRIKDDYAQKTDERIRTTFDERLIYVRNQRMAERMIPHLAKGNAFVAVGALHLSGERGMLNLLAERDYRISRVY